MKSVNPSRYRYRPSKSTSGWDATFGAGNGGVCAVTDAAEQTL
jgi:hypothetical protein